MDLTKIGSTYGDVKSGNFLSSNTNDKVNKFLGIDSVFKDIQDGLAKQRKFYDKLSTKFYTPDSNYRKSSGSSHLTDVSPSILKYADDPTMLGFKLIIGSHSPLFNTEVAESDEKQHESALSYLLSVNQTDRAKKLLNFIESFKLLINEYPYYLQEMSGLGDLYKIESKKSYYERKLKITTLESIDMFVSAMMHDYINAVYDFDNLKWVVPINLTFFDLIIYISEVRNFKSVVNILDHNNVVVNRDNILLENANINVVTDKDSMYYLNKYIGAYALRFNECEFVSDNINSYLSSISHKSPKIVENEINMKLGKMSFHLTNLHPFSHVSQYYDEIFPFANGISVDTEYDLSRFGNEEIKKSDKTLFQKAGDIVKKEVANTANGIIKQVDTAVGKTVSLAEDKLETLGKELISEYSPANIANRLVGDEISKISRRVNDGLNSAINDLESKITNKTGNLIKDSEGGHLASLIINQNDIASSDKSITSSSTDLRSAKGGTSEPLPDIKKTNNDIKAHYNIELKENKRESVVKESADDIKKKILDVVLYGTNEEKLLRETLMLGNINQKIK